MEVCRICLTEDPDKDIYEGQLKNDNSFVDIVLFCLDIKIIKDSKVTTKICIKCYNKTVSFNKFKLLALKNNAYLESLSNQILNNSKEYLEETPIKTEDGSMTSDCDDYTTQVKEELNTVKDEVDDQSDDELLSVIKKMKYNNVDIEDQKENVLKKKRGRPRKDKSTPITQICEECGKTVKNIKAHLELHKPLEKRIFIKCTLCDKTFRSKHNRYTHIRRKHLGIKKQCKICDKLVTNLKSHHLLIHDKESLPHECVSCGQKFISQTKLKEHMYQHTKDRPYECDVCQKRFRLKLSMVSHKRSVHNKEKSHLCQFCSKSFFKKYHLQLHLRIHTKEKPYKCKQCDKSFSTTSTLKNHEMIHSQVKMFSCELCDMAFVRPDYLRTHMISHTKVKRYPCQYCDMKFHRSDHRRRHERTAHLRLLSDNA